MSQCQTCGAPLPTADAVCPDCSTRQIPTAADDYPEIPGYRILRRLGEGGMGQVFLAEDVNLGRRVAIKLISERVTQDTIVVSRFAREARLLATIEHPHVVRVYSLGHIDNRPYLVMEYVEGESLADRIRRGGALPVAESLRILREAAEGLEAAQELNIIHRDVKPANILLDRRGRVRVADFGLAKRPAADSAGAEGDSSITQSGYLVGSPHYLSPEQAQGNATDFRTDLYALGVVLYEMLTGERPFSGSTPIAIVAKHLHDPLPPVQSKRPDVPAGVARLVERLTAKERDERPAAYRELIGEIDRLLAAPAEQAAMPTMVQDLRTIPPTEPQSATRAPRAVAVAAAIVIVALMVFWWNQTRPMMSGGTPASAPAGDRRLAIAVAPFYGPDAESEREGRVMAALVERSIGTRLAGNEVRLLGIEETKTPVRSHDEARALAEKLHAHVVVWGEAFSLRGETEIQPYLTVVGLQSQAAEAPSGPATASASKDPLGKLAEEQAGAVRLTAQAPNQIEMRKTSAEGVGQMATFLAGIYALHREGNAQKALRLFEQAPPSTDLLREKAQAYVVLGDNAKAIELMQQAIAADPRNAGERVQLADLSALEGRLPEAVAQLREASKLGSVPSSYVALADGRLLLRDSYKSEWLADKQRRETGNLLVLDPDTLVVEKRFPMPGTIVRFEPKADGATIVYETHSSPGKPDSLEFVNGGFPTPLMRGGNLLLRMLAMKSGWVLASNFIRDVQGMIDQTPGQARFRVTTKDVDRGQPVTYADLEAKLRAAIARDPTQPWHEFYLGQTLSATGRPAEAAAVWNAMLARPYEGIGYNEWAWMAFMYGRYGQFDWMRRAIARVEAMRKADVQPVIGTTLIERLINLHYTRLHPQQQVPDAIRRELLQSVRRVSGPTEGDHLAAWWWEKALRKQGDERGAEEEAAWYSRSAANPFDMPATAVETDYAIYALVASVLTFATLLWWALAAGLRGRRAPASLVSRAAALWRSAIAGPYRLVVLIGAIVAVCALALIAFVVWDSHNTTPLWFAAVIVAALLVALRPALVGTSWRELIASISLRVRVLVVASGVLVLVAGLVATHEVTSITAFSSAPIGGADSLGHIDMIRALEERQAKHDSAAVRYALAVANHLAGRFDRAESLYRSVGTPRAARAIDRLRRHDRHVEITGEDFVGAFKPAKLLLAPEEVVQMTDERNVPIVAFAFVCGAAWLCVALLLVMLVTFWVIRPQPPRVAPPASLWRERLLPGAHAFDRGAPVAGAITIFASWLVLAVAIGAWRSVQVFGSPGILNAIAIPDLFSAFPLPSGTPHSPRAWLFAHPHAPVFWSIVAVFALWLVVAHATAIAATWRERRTMATRPAEVEPAAE